MALTYERRVLIGELTKDIISIYDIDIPISDIDSVVKTIGGTVREDDHMSRYSDGFIRKVDDCFEIVVSKQQPLNRRNFTIAHELGHLFLHMGYKIDEERWENLSETYFRRGNSDEEYEANEFAAALLMPEAKYKEVMDKYTDGDIVYTEKIANEFNVSINAASNRGKWLGYLQW